MRKLGSRTFLAVATLLGLAGCLVNQQQNLGLVTDEKTGLAYGAMTRGSIVTDPALHRNKRLKINIRNTSGDDAFDIKGFRKHLETVYRGKGFEPTAADDFGLLLDVNVRYSGLIQEDLRHKFAYLGGAWGLGAGLIKGAEGGTDITTQSGAILGSATGASIGALLGSFIRENTYIVITRISYGVRKLRGKSGRVVTFSRSEKIDEDPQAFRDGFRRFHDFDVSVYGGAGLNIAQSRVTEGVRERLLRIVGDAI